MSKTIAVFGVGPGMGRSVARRFGREGFQVALVARNQTRLDAFTRELAADGIEAAGFAGDIADRDALPGMIEPVTARFGPIDVLEDGPSAICAREKYDPAVRPTPQNPADLADAMWDLYLKRDRFDQVFGA